MFHVSIHTKNTETDSSWSAIPSNTLVQTLHTHFNEGSMRWIAVFLIKGEEHRIALGSPDGSTDLHLHLPEWFIHSLGISDGEQIVRFEPSEGMQRATRLEFRSIEPIPEWLDIRDVLEEPLSQLGVIKQGQIIPIPVLDSSVIILHSAEPIESMFLFLDGDEIAIDVFSELPEAIAETVPITEDVVHAVAVADPVTVTDFSFIEMPKTGFIPFSGKGNILGGSKS